MYENATVIIISHMTYLHGQNIDLVVTQPDDITFSTGSKTQNGGRWRYQYSVSWKVRNSLVSEIY